MIKRYYLEIKKYFSLGANSKKCLFWLFITAFLRSLSLLTIPYMASVIVDYITLGKYEEAIISVVIFMICSTIYVLFHHSNYVAYKNNSIFTHNKLQDLILKKVAALDENFTKKMSTSFIVNTAFNDVGNVMQVPDFLFDIINYLINAIISLIILFNVNIYIGLLVLLLNIFSLCYVNKHMKIRDFYLGKQRKMQDKIISLFGQVMDGNKEIKSFNMSEDLQNYLEDYKGEWRQAYFKKRIHQDNLSVKSSLILGFGKIAVYFIMAYLVLNGSLNVASLVLVIGYFEGIQSQFDSIRNRLGDLSSNSIRINRIYDLLNYKNKHILEYGSNATDEILGGIVFKNIYFNYEKQDILKNINFTIKPQSFVAIVGKSGSGKSTIFRLLLRLYKPDKGLITLDDVDIYDYDKSVYSSNVSIVTQKPFIFDMSIRENLNLVDSNQKNQIEACKRAGIHDFIMSLKDGYNTKLVADAENISSGQKQLIALARTLLSKSEVLLFDEVTSTLDLNTSKKIIAIMKDLKKDHTILMITHKPSLMKMADRIIVIDRGKKVGDGSHSELMKNNVYYQALQK